DGRLGQALLSIPAVKAVSIGDGVAAAARRGSSVHDAILPGAAPNLPAWGLMRGSNNAGGVEGGVSNGEDIRITGWMKPIATLMRPLPSVDLSDGTPALAAVERSDTCAVPAAGVVGEAVVALVLADAFTEKFGSDSMEEIEQNYVTWKERLAARFLRGPVVP
ncbi:MAG: chorismate synthase, partial [Acidobacteria bacterium]